MILGLFLLGADPDSIRRSYRRLAGKWHPDKHRGTDYADAFLVNYFRIYKLLLSKPSPSEFQFSSCLK